MWTHGRYNRNRVTKSSQTLPTITEEYSNNKQHRSVGDTSFFVELSEKESNEKTHEYEKDNSRSGFMMSFVMLSASTVCWFEWLDMFAA